MSSNQGHHSHSLPRISQADDSVIVASQPEPKSRHVHKIDVLKQVMMDKSHSIQSIGPDVPPV